MQSQWFVRSEQWLIMGHGISCQQCATQPHQQLFTTSVLVTIFDIYFCLEEMFSVLEKVQHLYRPMTIRVHALLRFLPHKLWDTLFLCYYLKHSAVLQHPDMLENTVATWFKQTPFQQSSALLKCLWARTRVQPWGSWSITHPVVWPPWVAASKKDLPSGINKVTSCCWPQEILCNWQMWRTEGIIGLFDLSAACLHCALCIVYIQLASFFFL